MSRDPDELRRLRDDLGSSDPVTRADALQRLEAVLGETVREVIAEGRASDNPEVRAQAEALQRRLDTA